MAGEAMPTTHWTMVSQATSATDPQARASLEELCRRYWSPVYAFLRHKGHDPEDALDLTQGFFERVLDPSFLAGADRNKGKFRTFLHTALQRYVNDQRKLAKAQKRGAAIDIVSFDTSHAERHCGSVTSATLNPDEAFERQWQIEQLEQAKARVKARMARNDRTERYCALQHLLTERPEPGEFARIAADLGLSEKATRLTVDRMRRMLEQELRRAVAEETSTAS